MAREMKFRFNLARKGLTAIVHQYRRRIRFPNKLQRRRASVVQQRAHRGRSGRARHILKSPGFGINEFVLLAIGGVFGWMAAQGEKATKAKAKSRKRKAGSRG